MVKTLLTPLQTNITISIPQKYVGKQIEVLFYAVNELKETAIPDSLNKRPRLFNSFRTTSFK